MATGFLPRKFSGAIPNKTNKVPAPRPGVPVPKMVSAVAKIVTARVTGTPLPKLQNTPGAPTLNLRRPPSSTRPIAPGAMPRKTFVSPKAAVPMRPRAIGANAVNPTVFDRLTRGRILQRGTR